jgi:carbonic anhydrase
MEKLVDGIHQFQRTIFSSHARLFERLVNGQQPLALFITCSDARIDPSLLTQTKPGELFIMRNAGNLVPPYTAVRGGEAATLEFAVAVLRVKDIVVCGHSHCGVMASLLRPESVDELPALRNWMEYAEPTARIIEENYAHLRDDQQRLTATVEENVLVQLEHLRTHPAVATALARNDLKLHGWVYKFETGEVFAYEPQRGQFAPVKPSNGRVTHATPSRLLM